MQIDEMNIVKMNLKRAAQQAVDVQSACNLSAVVRSFADVTRHLWDQAHDANKGTDFVNRHPITVLFTTQLGHLSRVAIIADDACNYGKSYDICKRLAAGEDVPLSEYPSENPEKVRPDYYVEDVPVFARKET